MHPMDPVEWRGDRIVIEPLRIEHAAGLLAAADADEVFAGFHIRARIASIKRGSGSRWKLARQRALLDPALRMARSQGSPT